MPLNVEIIEHHECLEAVVTGHYDTQQAIDAFPHVLSICRLKGLSKILIDFRKISGVPAATEKIIYAYGILDHYDKHTTTGGQELMVAYVGRPPQISTYQPGLEIAKERNMPFEVFTDMTACYQWLGIEPA